MPTQQTKQWLLLHLLLTICPSILVYAMQIPQDVEILEGYQFDDSPEYYASDPNYYESRSLLTGLHKAIRNKRSTLEYDQAKGLSLEGGGTQANAIQDFTQNVGSQQIKVHEKEGQEENAEKLDSNMPRAEKQVMDPDFDYYSQRHISAWNDGYGTSVADAASRAAASDSEDVMADASTSYLARGRQARVNFITQPKKDVNEYAKELPDPIQPKLPNHKVNYDVKYPNIEPSYNYEMYPSRTYAPYLRRYDRFDDPYSRYEPYNYEDHYLHRRHYDPYDSYSPRLPQYPEPYYNYPDRRYDIPEPRDYVPLYNNEVYDKTPPYAAASYAPVENYASSKYPDYPRNQRRIVYYAHLPEIVRTPYDYANRYDGYDSPIKPSKPVNGAYKYDKATPVGGSSMTGGSNPNTDSYDYMKRDKKDRPTPKPSKTNVSGRQ